MWPVLGAAEGAPAVMALWLAVAIGAWVWPRHSLLAWLGVAPLLPIVPSLLEWQEVPLPTFWLSALAVPALVRFLARPDPPSLPRTAALWALVTTASTVVVLFPFYDSASSLGGFLWEMREYASTDLMSVVTQRPRLSPVMVWFVLAEGIVVLWLVLFTFRDRTADRGRWLQHVACAIALAATAVAVWGIWQRYTRRALLLDWILLDPSIVRINASFTDVNALGAYLASTLPLVLALLVAARRAEVRVAAGLASAAIVAATVFTVSRAAWGGMTAGVALLVVGLLYWRLPSWSQTAYRVARGAVVLTMLVLAVALAAATAWGTARNVRVVQRSSYVEVLLHTLNLQASPEDRLRGRLQFWAAASRMAATHPLAGVGVGRYFKEVYRWAPNQAALVRKQENAHNYYLQVAAETGLPGALIFVALLGLGIASGIRVCRSQAPQEARIVALGASGGILAFAISLLTGHSVLLHEGQVTFWPLVGLALLMGREWRHEEGQATRDRWGRLVVPVALGVLLVTLPPRLAGSVNLVDVRVSGELDESWRPDGVGGLWTGERATIDVPAAARGARILVRFVAPFPQSIEVSLDGRPVERVDGKAGQGLELRYLIPRVDARGRYRRIELSVSPTWTREGSRKPLGVIIEAAEWMP